MVIDTGAVKAFRTTKEGDAPVALPDYMQAVDQLPMRIGRGRKGRISAPIFAAFLDSGLEQVKIDTTKAAPGRSAKSFFATLRSYAALHPEQGVEAIFVDDNIYLIRSVAEVADDA